MFEMATLCLNLYTKHYARHFSTTFDKHVHINKLYVLMQLLDVFNENWLCAHNTAKSFVISIKCQLKEKHVIAYLMSLDFWSENKIENKELV